MANRYWVGGTGNWSDNTNHWSDSSGGSPGVSKPGSTDDVYIDSSSGFGSGGAITLDGSINNIVCKNFISNSGHSYNITTSGRDLNIYGSSTFESGLTITSNISINYHSSSLGETITSNGFAFYNIYFIGSGEWTLQDTLEPDNLNSINISNGELDTNSQDVQTNFLSIFGSGILTCSSSIIIVKVQMLFYGNGTLNYDTSTFILGSSQFDSSLYLEKIITFNDVEIVNTGIKRILFSENFNITCNNFTINAGAEVHFKSGKTFTINGEFIANGTSGNEIEILSDSDGNEAFISKVSGIVECDYLTLKDNTATGGATWNATNSTEVSNVTGWNIFAGTTTSTSTSTSTTTTSTSTSTTTTSTTSTSTSTSTTTTSTSTTTTSTSTSTSTTTTSTSTSTTTTSSTTTLISGYVITAQKVNYVKGKRKPYPALAKKQY